MEKNQDMFLNIQNYLGLVLTIVLSLSGIITNIINLKIFNYKDFSKQSIFFYLKVIAYYDMFEIGLAWISLLPNVVFFFNTTSCRIITFISKSLFSAVSWTVAIYSIDRVFWLVWPMKMKLRKSITFQLSIIFTVLLLCIFLNIPFMLYYDLAMGDFNESMYCVDIHEETRLSLYIFYSTLYLFIPFTTMILTGIVIVTRLFHLKTRVKLNKGLGREIDFARTIILMDIVFILFKTPILFEMFWFDFYPHRNDFNFYYNSRIFLYVVKALSYVQNSSSFFIYMTFNKLYRSHFNRLISRKKNYRFPRHIKVKLDELQ
jgi:hypothetical protein